MESSPLFAGENSVILTGRCDEKDIQNIEIVTYPHFWTAITPIEIVQEDKETDNQFHLRFEIDYPIHAYFMMFGRTANVYISPGDSLTFTITRENNQSNIHLEVAHAAYYNYEPEMWEHMKLYPYSTDYSDMANFKESLDDWFDRKMKFLEEYENRHELSKYFRQYSKKEIQYEYVYRLYNSLYREKAKSEDLPEDYYDRVKTFNLNGDYIHFSGYNYLAYTHRYIFRGKPDIWGDFDSTYHHILNDFKGKIRSYLITNLIGVYPKEQSLEYRSSLNRAIEESTKYVDDPASLKYINECSQDYLTLNQPFPSSALNSTYFTPLGEDKKISLSELLNKYKDKPLYVDFWASWCSPCLEDISHSESAKQLLKKKEIVYPYISVDKKEYQEKWEEAVRDHDIAENQYHLSSDLSSPVARFLKINFIPRYLIMDKDHKLASTDAPRPTKYQLSKLETSIKQLNQQVFRY